MNILVCMSVVPDTTTKIVFNEDKTQLQTQGVQFIINPYDEIALTRAVELVEKNGGNVTVINVGNKDAEPVIRKALAIGANDAIRINAKPSDGQMVATQIAEIVKQNQYDLIMTGRESIDYNSGMVCGYLAELIGWNSVNICSKVDFEGGNWIIERDIDGGRETVKTSGNLVVSAQKDLCEPRIPNMKGIMSARTKPLVEKEPVSEANFAHYAQFESPAAKQSVRLINPEQPEELINILRNELKVI